MTRFAATQPFELDPFQIEACQALERGECVLVCAPTGAGKTVVGEFAVARALAAGAKCFYTTPIKALSNQKYGDLTAEYGSDTVGLLTGDTSINSHAPIVVMTTEVLRNMLYAGSPDLDGLAAVVLDEIHFLADKFRGAVWEEVILHLPATVQVVGLSATVSNAEEFGDWLRTVRGQTTVVVDEVRPVPLWQHMMVGRRIFDLYAERTDEPGGGPMRDSRRRIDPALQRAISAADSAGSRAVSRSGSRSGFGPRQPRSGLRPVPGRGRDAARWRPAPRPVMVDRLDAAGLLPAIVFVFSRAGCDGAVEQCLRAGIRLTDDHERAAIGLIVDRHTAGLPPADLETLGYWSWRAALERGIAAHHAGLLPAFKETVEELFAEGLVKVVFATETLALGINMPARTVVLERLVKYNGESHAEVTPGEYTQLTGRAGRRGIDVEGHAVVVWSPEVDVHAVAGLAAARTFPLRSSFRPTYNMTVNLIARRGRAAARSLLEQSFAQFQTDRTIVGTARQVRLGDERIHELEAALACERGDAAEYADLVTRLASAERAAASKRSSRRWETIRSDLATLRRGDVIYVPAGRRAGLAVVLDARPGPDGSVRPLVATDRAWAGRLVAADFRGAVPVLGRLRLRKHTEHREPSVRRDLASALASSGIRPPARDARSRGQVAGGADGGAGGNDADADRIEVLRRAVRSHPVHSCPDREWHLQTARARTVLAAQNEELRGQVERSRQSLGRSLDRIADLLASRGYLDGDRATGAGRILQRVWSESDLVATECARRGVWAQLPAGELAAAVSTLVFESRRDLPAGRRALGGPVGDAVQSVVDVWQDVVADEDRFGIDRSRAPDPGFATAVCVWADGGTLADALASAAIGGVDLSPGDFVRWCRQTVDLLDQIRIAAPAAAAPRAGDAIAAIRRGVVALGVD
jgi:ATP-dependent RNA helicase HelY